MLRRRSENKEWQRGSGETATQEKESTQAPFSSFTALLEESFYFRFLVRLRRFDFLAAFFGFSAAASSRRFFAAPPGLLTWRPRAIANPSVGTLSVMVEPAPTYAPSPTRTGATRAVSLPMKTLFPLDVGYLWKPS